ncbi:hypothetical protein [Saccharibacter floricola]|uniref:Uncharacterized protein n=1 Tax=Saccharibacter floricola DSM 15669 TaxID=1123227 RepID=A0ABQ0P065_9PROT|nr:hypothetical protein [Saccharibacter floricola]GBQ07946.1 hypothetical protein AA15669_1599 [Saccharibacter floricola DSM 15669]
MTEKNLEKFFLWYQDPLICLSIENCYSLVALFTSVPYKNGYNWNDKKEYYSLEWCQNSLDFLYRTVVSGLCDFTFSEDTLRPIIDKLAKEGPGVFPGYGVWEEDQIYITDKGRALLRECHVDVETKETSFLLKEKLTKLFYDCGVGFEKNAFVKMHDYPPEIE